jgi:hypothetical protein
MKKICSIIRSFFHHELSGFIILGLLLRTVLMPYLVGPFDISEYQSGLAYFMSGYDPYALHASIYPPLTHFLTFPLLRLAYQFGMSFGLHSVSEILSGTNFTGLIPMSEISPLFLILWKTPLVCFDLATGILIYHFVKELTSDTRMPKLCFIFWFFNPLTLAISSLLGSYDAATGFFILLGAFFLFKSSYFSAGFSFGLGSLTKISPIFVAFPLAAVLLFKRDSVIANASRFRSNARDLLRFAVGCGVPLASFAPLVIEYTGLMSSGISKEISITGGLNQWFFATDTLRSEWVNSNIAAIQTAFLYYPAIALVTAILFSRFFKLDQKSILFLTALFTVLIYFFLPMGVQPQYLLWVLPLLVLLPSIAKRYIWSISICSVAGLLFFLSVQGPQVFLYPLAMFTSLYPPRVLAASVTNYLNLPGFFSLNLRQDLCTIFGGLGFLGLLLTTVLLLKSLWVKDNEK